MAAMVYTFHIAYEGLEDTIWRKADVSSRYRLNQLGYLTLAAFDTMAYHLFAFVVDGKRYDIPSDDFSDDLDMADIRLEDLGLNVGDRFSMEYDFGTTQTFRFELLAVREMKKGAGRHYPYITEGKGSGILDDVSCEDFKELIKQIDQNGKTDEPIYYKERITMWDYRKFDLDFLNTFLKYDIGEIEEAYSSFWEDAEEGIE